MFSAGGRQSEARYVPCAGASRLRILCVVAVLGLAVRVDAQPGPDAQASSVPGLCGSTEIHVVVEPNSVSATAQAEFCAAAGGSSASALLTAGDFTSRMTKFGLNSPITFSRPGETGADSSFRLNPIKPGDTVLVKIQISNLWEAGEAEAPLRLNGKEIGRLIATKYRLPFGVKVDAVDPARPEIVLERDQAYDVVLKNDDPLNYQVDWELSFPAGSPQSGHAVLTPGGSAKFTIRGDPRWYEGFAGVLKDYDADAKLTLGFRPPDAPNPYWPAKVVPVRFHLRYASDGVRAWLVNIVLVLVLFAGAAFSFAGSVGLPNRIKRSERRERLALLAQRIGDISQRVDSQLRVVVGVQRKRLTELLTSRLSISPDLRRVFDQVDRGTLILERQVALAERIDAAHVRLASLDAKGAPPSGLGDVQDLMWKAAESINQVTPSDADLGQAEKLINLAQSRMDKADEYDADFAKKIIDRLNDVRQRLLVFQVGDAYQRLSVALPGVFGSLATTAVPATFGDSSRLDGNVAKLELILQFLQVYQATQDHEALDRQLARLVHWLSLESFYAIRKGLVLVREVREGVYPSDLALAGWSGSPRIEIDPPVVQPHDLVRYGIHFDDPRFNSAAAREEFEGRWSFGHDGYGEVGWDPFHYFPRAGSFEVVFEFQSSGDKEAIRLTRKIDVAASREWWYQLDRNRVELARFVIMLVPALFGLLAGAREQFLKMDVASAFFAVFLLGFGSDTIKNLVSQSQATAASPPAPPAPGGSSGAAAGEAGAPPPKP